MCTTIETVDCVVRLTSFGGTINGREIFITWGELFELVIEGKY